MLSLQSATQTHSDRILTHTDFISPALKCVRGKNIFKARNYARETDADTERQTESLSHTHTETHTRSEVRVLIRGAVARSGQVCCIFRQICEDHGIKE